MSGTLRLITKFAVIPDRIESRDGDYIVWWERYVVLQRYSYHGGWRTVQKFPTSDVNDPTVIRFVEESMTEDLWMTSKDPEEMFPDPTWKAVRMKSIDMNGVSEEVIRLERRSALV